MFLIPLNQIESVELVIHALRSAGGEADCVSCPARKVCMKQCLTIAESVQRMVQEGSLPELGAEEPKSPQPIPRVEPSQDSDLQEKPAADRGRHLKIIK